MVAASYYIGVGYKDLKSIINMTGNRTYFSCHFFIENKQKVKKRCFNEQTDSQKIRGIVFHDDFACKQLLIVHDV